MSKSQGNVIELTLTWLSVPTSLLIFYFSFFNFLPFLLPSFLTFTFSFLIQFLTSQDFYARN